MWVFTTNNDVDSENLGLHGPANIIFSISTIISWWVKLRISIAQILIITHVLCKCNQPQLGQSTIWANNIMIVKTTSSRNVCCIWKRIMFQIISLMMGVNYLSMVFYWGSNRKEINQFQSLWLYIQYPRLSLRWWAVSVKQTAALGVLMP